MRHLALALVVVVAPAVASAHGLMAQPDPSTIYGGNTADTCEWPSTVFLGGCTGTLVHPQVVIYAAHCGSDVAWAWFGENSNQQEGRYVSTEFCRVYPGGEPGYGTDFAFCKLAESVDDVPIVPPLMGCETEILQPGLETWLVGFGNTDTGDFGRKYEVGVQLQYIENDEAFLGGGGLAPCYGDSGGPAFVRLPAELDPEQSWRVFGITSWGGECGGGGFYSMMHNGMTWFEDEAGVDVTPCHDGDGTWNPGPDCHSFPLDPGVGVGTWPACGAGPRSGAGATCGAGDPDPGGDDTGGDDAGEGQGSDDGVPPPADEGGHGSDADGGGDDAGVGETAADDGESDDGDDGDDDEDLDDPEAVLPPGFGLDAAEHDGCGCATRPTSSGGIAFALVALRRRRRSATARTRR